MSKVGRASRNASFKRVETLGNGTSTAVGSEKVIITLPPLKEGAYFKFIWKTDMTANGTVVINSADNTAGDFAGSVLEQITGGSNADSAFQAFVNHDILTISDDIDPGSYLECVCDGSTWFWTGVLSVSAVGLIASST